LRSTQVEVVEIGPLERVETSNCSVADVVTGYMTLLLLRKKEVSYDILQLAAIVEISSSLISHLTTSHATYRDSIFRFSDQSEL
jgi:hypothetical protein